MSRHSEADWHKWRRQYVEGDDSVTLEVLSNTKNSPSLAAFKRRSTREAWVDQRMYYRTKSYTLVQSDPVAIEAAAKVSQLVDVAELIARQTKIAKALQALASKWLATADVKELKASDAIAMFREGAKIEQLLLGLATERMDVTTDGQPLAPTKIEIVAVDGNGTD